MPEDQANSDENTGKSTEGQTESIKIQKNVSEEIPIEEQAPEAADLIEKIEVKSDQEEMPKNNEEEAESGQQIDNSGFNLKEGIQKWGTSKGKQAKGTGRHWYVLHTYSGYEDAVEKALRQRIEALNMQDYIFDVRVPKESQIIIKRGEPVQEKKRIFPGYVLVEMIVTDDSWYVVRNTPNVTGFVGSGNIPVPVTPEEFGIIEKRTSTGEGPRFKIEFKTGEHVAIIGGPFANYDGIIDKIDPEKGKVKVLVSIFDRETPIELDFTQVKKK